MIYLDHNATTPIHSEVLEAMMPYLEFEWGNPSSSYRFGSKIKTAINKARESVAALINAHPNEIIFTSGGTESNNAAINAALKACPNKRHIITSCVEHSSVLNYCKSLENIGYKVTYLPVNREGILNISDLENAITPETAIVSLMWANNETGVIFPIKEISEICKSKGVLFHCDAVQAVGKIEVDVKKVNIDYLSITGHKLYAPKGIGALFVRKKAPFSPLIIGGHQENGRRGGTENVPFIIGFGKAAEITLSYLKDYEKRVRPLRDYLEDEILKSIPDTELNGHKVQRIPNTTNITFHNVLSAALILLLDEGGVCVSSGSACLADSTEPSHVIKAMKPDDESSRQMIRFSLGYTTTFDQVKNALEIIKNAVEELR
jgi:cysteine desulfurase